MLSLVYNIPTDDLIGLKATRADLESISAYFALRHEREKHQSSYSPRMSGNKGYSSSDDTSAADG